MADHQITIGSRDINAEDMRAALAGPIKVKLSDDAVRQINASQAAILQLLDSGDPIYGVNTGFGKLAKQRIDREDLDMLQVNIVRSHAAGVGKPLPPGIVRLVMLLKAASLARGASGVRVEVVQSLLALLNQDLLPLIPSQGSVGASGDLAPLAHMSLAVIGEGEIFDGTTSIPAAVALQAAKLQPVRLGPKEGLALLNGTQVSTALALSGLFEAERNCAAALVAGAMSVDAIMGSDTPFDARIHALRGQPGQIMVAGAIRKLMSGSEIRASHVDCERVQDPYSFRCQPQVMGACVDLLTQAWRTLRAEANAVTDNPLVFTDGPEVLSGGNFHAEPVAFAADIIALAIAETGALSERRLAALIDSSISELPPFLAENPGLDSGYMLAQVTAAALASENKQLSHPASTDSLPTSANQEDHVSMATHGSLRLKRMNANTRRIVGIELLAAADGIDFRTPLKTSPLLQQSHATIRSQVAVRRSDRVFTGDIEAVAKLIREDSFTELTGRPVTADD